MGSTLPEAVSPTLAPPAVIWQADGQGNLIYHSEEFYHYTGLDPAHRGNGELQNAIHRDDLPKLAEQWQRSRASGAKFEVELRLRGADGVYRWHLTCGRPVKDAAGAITGWLGTHTDINEGKQARETLREQAAMLERAYMMRCELDGTIIFWNQALEQLYGWSREEALGRVSQELLQTGFPQPLPEIMASLLQTGSWQGELVRTRRDGMQIVVASQWLLRRDEQDAPTALLKIDTDITRLKQTEAALRTAHTRNAHILNNMISGFIILDHAWRIVYVNKAGVVQARQPREALLGRNFWEMAPEVAGTELQRQLERAMARQTPASFEYYFPPYDAWFNCRVIPAMEGIAVFTNDITARKQAEEALRQSNQRLVNILESISETFFALNRQWQITYVNQQGLKSARLTLAEVIGQNIWEIFPGLTGTPLEAAYRKAMAEQVPAHLETQGILTGTWYETHIYPSVDGLSIFGRDITGRKQIEAAWRASEERFAKAFQATPNILTISRRHDGVIFEINDSFEKRFGYSREEVIGKTATELNLYLEPADRQRAVEQFQRQGFLRDYELKLRTRSGEIRHFSLSTKPLPLNEEPCLLTIMRDITEQKQAERALQASEQEFRAIFELAGSGNVVVNPVTSRFVRVNQRYCEFTGYTEAELLAMTAPEVTYPEDRQHEQALVWPVRQGWQDHWQIEKRYLRKDGQVVWGLVTGRLTRDENGQPLHTIATVQDITARRQAEEALRRAHDQLEQQVAERTAELERSLQELHQFTYIASHDLKTPLRGMRHLVQWIDEEAGPLLPETARLHLARLEGRIDRLENFLNDLLLYSRLDYNYYHDVEQVDTNVLVKEIIELLAPPPHFTITLQTPLPSLMTRRVPLELVFRNLIENAIKHHHRPEGRIEVSAREVAGLVEFTIADDGPGIDPAFHQRVFQIFQTLQPRDQVEGSGAGLAIAKKAVESQGGTITLTSAPGAGATFRFTWPQHTERAGDDPAVRP